MSEPTQSPRVEIPTISKENAIILKNRITRWHEIWREVGQGRGLTRTEEIEAFALNICAVVFSEKHYELVQAHQALDATNGVIRALRVLSEWVALEKARYEGAISQTDSGPLERRLIGKRDMCGEVLAKIERLITKPDPLCTCEVYETCAARAPKKDV